MKSWRSHWLFVAACLFFLISTSPGQSIPRLVEKLPLHDPKAQVADATGRLVPTDLAALRLLEIKVGENAVVSGREFLADSDWLESFSIKIRNISGRVISSIRVSFMMPEAKFKEGTRGFTLEFGKELSTGIDYGVQKPMAPDAELILKRNDRHYERDRLGLIKTNGNIDITKILIGPATVKFSDGTVWYGPMLAP